MGQAGSLASRSRRGTAALQLVMQQRSFELSVQRPAVRDLADDGPKTDGYFVACLLLKK